MRTTAFAPPFPTDLGSWMGAFRHRVTNERGHPISPEQIGREIGVSGATIRRWEAGRLRPNPDDAASFARACKLTTLQVAFLNRALRAGGLRPVPDFETFREKATPILSSPFPTLILDSMLYIRGWNSYLPNFLQRMLDTPGGDYHLVEFILDGEHPGVEPGRRERIRQTVLELWYLTSDACGTEEYVALIERLSENDLFREEWASMAFLTEDNPQKIGQPRRAWRAGIGETLICPFSVVLPPVYQVRQFIPMDEVAHARLDGLRRDGPPKVEFEPKCHWAQTAENKAFVMVP